MIQVSILLQPHRTVVANFVPRNFGLFRRNPKVPQNPGWKTLVYTYNSEHGHHGLTPSLLR